MAFVAAAYWDLEARSTRARSPRGSSRSTVSGSRRVATSATTESCATEVVRLDEEAARGLAARSSTAVLVRSVEEKPYSAAPLRRSRPRRCSRRRAASSASPRRRRCASPSVCTRRLHHLHAHRLDDALRVRPRRSSSQARSSSARSTCRTGRAATTKVKNAQEAHEAIRPAGERSAAPQRWRASWTRTSLRSTS